MANKSYTLKFNCYSDPRSSSWVRPKTNREEKEHKKKKREKKKRRTSTSDVNISD